MKAYPLQSISIEQAMDKQFRMVSCIMHNFGGYEQLSRGDLGIHQPENEPLTTMKAEEALAEFFNCEMAMLVRGSGTGAIRYGLASMLKANDKILIHDAPIYSTTKTSFEMLGLIPVTADFNDPESIRKVLNEDKDITAALVQYSRQQIEDHYDMKEVVETIRNTRDIPIITDDNYAVMKVEKIGVNAVQIFPASLPSNCRDRKGSASSSERKNSSIRSERCTIQVAVRSRDMKLWTS